MTPPPILAPDVRLRLRDGARVDRVADLAPAVRERVAAGNDELPDDAAVLSRPGARASVVQIDPDTASLLHTFGDGSEAGATVAEAVLRLARERETDPEELLEASLPVVQRLFGKGYLVDADAPPARLGYEAGDEIGRWQVVGALARMEDGEALLVRCSDPGHGSGDWAVLKISAPERRFGLPEDEAEILRWLGESESGPSPFVPRLLDQGEEAEGRRWIAIEHVPGVPLRVAASGLRRRLGHGGHLRDLAQLCRAVAVALADLHRRGVVHGDLHPDNVLTAQSENRPSAWLVDFGCARRFETSRSTSSRPGNAYYREPELAAAVLAGRARPSASPSGEQYAAAAMLYFVCTGRHYLDFAVDAAEVTRQIVEDPPRSFVEAGARPWPEMERILGRALSKAPADRFESMDDLVSALDDVVAATTSASRTPGGDAGRSAIEHAAARVSGLVRPFASPSWFRTHGDSDLEPPSFFFGTAGLAWSLLQAAVRRGDPESLALADVWATRAVRAVKAAVRDPSARFSGWPTAPWHGAAGVYETAACVAYARGDRGRFSRHARNFLAESNVEVAAELTDDRSLDLDLAMGRPGTLVATAHLLTRTGDLGHQPLHAELEEFGDRWHDQLWQRLDERPAMGDDGSWLGLAHGWGGALYATLVWCREAHRDLPAAFAERLAELAASAVPHGRGLRWPWHRAAGKSGPRPDMAGWCHGSAGYVLLFSAVSRLPEFGSYDRLAEAAAWDVWDRFAVARKPASHLCCGLIGQAWSLLVRARDTGDAAWRQRARAMLDVAARRDVWDRPDGDRTPFDGALFKGRGSLLALAADLGSPDHAAWPWLEDLDGSSVL